MGVLLQAPYKDNTLFRLMKSIDNGFKRRGQRTIPKKKLMSVSRGAKEVPEVKKVVI